MSRALRVLVILAALGIATLLATTSRARAEGVAAGTSISNQAQVAFTVNGAPQTTNSNSATFLVDRKVNFTLVSDPAVNTQVNLAQTGAVSTFRLTNTTNAAQDFLLDASQSGLSLGILPGTDNFDVTNVRVFADSNGNGVYDAGVDTGTFVDELAADASISVFVVVDVPNQSNAALAFFALHATAAAGGASGTAGAALVATDLLVPNSDTVVDIVFADGDSDGVFAGDIARNGQARVYAAFEVGTHAVDLSFVKSQHVVSDGFNVTNPRAMPGAVVEYCLTVRNQTLLTAASGLTLTDVVPGAATYVAGSISVGDVGLPGTCVANGIAEDDDTDDAAEIDPYRGSFDPASRTVTVLIPTLAGGATRTVAFRVTIN